MDGYEGINSVLVPYHVSHTTEERAGIYAISAWREIGRDELRSLAIREFATYLCSEKISGVAGPVLSGAIFAQIVSESCDVNPYFLGKPGYTPTNVRNDRGQ